MSYSNRNDAGCPRRGSTRTTPLLRRPQSLPNFGTTGDAATRKREIAAFLGQTSHETTGGWPSAPDGPYSWGYCYLREQNPSAYCSPNPTYPCAPGKQY